jgi:hypothetical protein
VAGLIGTLAIVSFVPSTALTAILLVGFWWGLFSPITRAEAVLFVCASIFFLVQNYLTLRDGLFEFRHKDVLLMPWYEPCLWGFYFLALKRFVSGTRPDRQPLEWKAVLAVIMTSAVFALFGQHSDRLTVATVLSTGVLFVLFHTATDVAYAASALTLGFIIEIFGVWTGLWWYPAPDFLGIPFWFATMWLSVGLLGRRFLVPAAAWLATRSQRA